MQNLMTMLHPGDDMIIIHVQSQSECKQDAAENGNVIQPCGDVVFKLLPDASSRNCGGDFLIKEEE